ncbi:MAG: DUF1178 family protein [Pseudomonadota bacterium]
MIVFDLVCKPHGHKFEGWFGSSADFDDQKARGLLTCPTCGSLSVSKGLMAPNVSAKGNQRPPATRPTGSNPAATSSGTVSNTSSIPLDQGEILKLAAEVQEKLLEQSEWVGDEFPEKAREIHYGETEEKSVHGIATPDEVDALEEEGIDIAPLPFQVTPPESQN